MQHTVMQHTAAAQSAPAYLQESAAEIHSALFGDSPLQSIANSPRSTGATHVSELVRTQIIPTPLSRHRISVHVASPPVLPTSTDVIRFPIPLAAVVQSHLAAPTPGHILTLSALDITEVLGVMSNICTVNAFIYACEADATKPGKREEARVCKKTASITGTNAEPMAASIAISPGSSATAFPILDAHTGAARGTTAAQPDRQHYELMATLMMTAAGTNMNMSKTLWQANLAEIRARTYQENVTVLFWSQSHMFTMNPLAWFLAHEMHAINKDVDCLCRTPVGAGSMIMLDSQAPENPFQMYLTVKPEAYCRVVQDLSEIAERSSHILTAESYLVVEIHPTRVPNNSHLIDISSVLTKPAAITIGVSIESTRISIDTVVSNIDPVSLATRRP